MCPYDYYTVMRHAIDPKHLRLRMVRYAQEHGVAPGDAAQVMGLTEKQVCRAFADFARKYRTTEYLRMPPRNID